jgi:hypothetical protein
MCLFPRRIEHAFNMPIQGSHNADSREHRWPIPFGNQDQRFHRGLPFWRFMFGLGQLGDVERGVA